MQNCRREIAFTLIELLVVISIIAVLAGLVLSVLPGTAKWRTRRAVESQLAQLVTLIERYKDERGYYPPSNNPRYDSTNLLFYELAGAQYSGAIGPATEFQVIGQPDIRITAPQIQEVYGGGTSRNRIFNSATKDTDNPSLKPERVRAYDPDAARPVRSLHAEVKEREFTTIAYEGGSSTFPLTLFAVPGRGTNANPDFNVWNYRVPGRHNPNGFDLWAVVRLGERGDMIVTMGNWKEGK